MFAPVYGLALHAMLGNRASSRGQWDVSWFFSSCSWNVGYILQLCQGWPSHVCLAMSGLLYSCEAHHRNLHEACQGHMDASRGEAEDQGSLSICHGDIGIPINFQEESGIVTF